MNRMIVAIAMLIIVTGISVFESCYVISVSDKVESNLQFAFVSYENNEIDKTKSHLYQAQKVWNDNRTLLNSMLIHNYTESISEDITVSINSLKYDSEDFPIECQKTIGAVQGIHYSMIPYIDNIL